MSALGYCDTCAFYCCRRHYLGGKHQKTTNTKNTQIFFVCFCFLFLHKILFNNHEQVQNFNVTRNVTIFKISSFLYLFISNLVVCNFVSFLNY